MRVWRIARWAGPVDARYIDDRYGLEIFTDEVPGSRLTWRSKNRDGDPTTSP